PQYSDARVADPVVVALRERVVAEVDPTLSEDAAHVRIRLKEGRALDCRVAHALGSHERPMSDRDLEAKFRNLTAAALDASAIDAIVAGCWSLETSGDSGALARLTVPRRDTEEET
ncbi:MAG TPA: MmgE/PrpD family protein, partial [Casimicrobiaceae bacterium]|nr:MmgE/PrpD family protein [Casimicrobiaceae bacterium]